MSDAAKKRKEPPSWRRRFNASFENPDGNRVSVGIPREDENLIPLGNEDFPVYCIYCYGLWIQQPCAGPENPANGRNITVGISAERENGKGVERGHEDLIPHRVVGHVVNRARELRILTCDCSYRLCTTIRQPGECRNLRVAHSV